MASGGVTCQVCGLENAFTQLGVDERCSRCGGYGSVQHEHPEDLKANEPDVFASPDADLDPESDTGEPEGWN